MQHYIAKPAVATRDVGGDLVLLDMDDGQYYSLNSTGAVVWQSAALADGATVDAMVDAICDAYQVNESAARADIEEVLGQLIDQGLVTTR
jgi:hypothetical protein